MLRFSSIHNHEQSKLSKLKGRTENLNFAYLRQLGFIRALCLCLYSITLSMNMHLFVERVSHKIQFTNSKKDNIVASHYWIPPLIRG